MEDEKARKEYLESRCFKSLEEYTLANDLVDKYFSTHLKEGLNKKRLFAKTSSKKY